MEITIEVEKKRLKYIDEKRETKFHTHTHTHTHTYENSCSNYYYSSDSEIVAYVIAASEMKNCLFIQHLLSNFFTACDL